MKTGYYYHFLNALSLFSTTYFGDLFVHLQRYYHFVGDILQPAYKNLPQIFPLIKTFSLFDNCKIFHLSNI